MKNWHRTENSADPISKMVAPITSKLLEKIFAMGCLTVDVNVVKDDKLSKKVN